MTKYLVQHLTVFAHVFPPSNLMQLLFYRRNQFSVLLS